MKALAIFGIYFVLMAHLDKCSLERGIGLLFIALAFAILIFIGDTSNRPE